MRIITALFLLLLATPLLAAEPKVQRDQAYTEPKNERQTLDVYAPPEGKSHPVVVWIHGGGWQQGDKTEVKAKPQAFVDRGFIFVSINYRLVPNVTIKQMAGDVAKAIRWTHDHAKDYGGDAKTMFVMGHSAGAQLAALVCTDDRYLKAEGLSLSIIKGCVPVDGDTYDVPMQIATVEQKRADSYKKKFGAADSQKDLSPVTHVAKGKNIPPFVILHVADHPETKAQAQRLVKALQEAGVSAKAYPAEGKNHNTLNDDLGTADDKPTKALFEFLSDVLKKPRNMSFLDNGIIKIGVDLKHGGSIGYLADVKTGRNVVNVHDLGRWIGQSYYSGPKPFGEPHLGWKEWPWNPVSAGDVHGNPAQVVESQNDGKTLYVKSIPRQWALKDVPGDCTFETWITLEGRTALVRNRLTNRRNDKTQYPAQDQELPAVYSIGQLHRLMTYTGTDPFTNGPLQEIRNREAKKDGAPWATFFATEHWAALVDDEDWGLGVIHPDVVRFLGGHAGKPNTGGPEDDSTGYIAPVRQEILDHDIVFDYRYSLVLDSLVNIRRQAYNHRPKSSLPDYHFTKDRQNWWYVNAADTGQPIKGHLRVMVEKDDPQMFGPEGLWDAKDASRIYIRAAHHTANKTGELFWETAEKPGFAADQSVHFTVQPDKQYHTYELDLTKLPTYQGKIRRIRFDPVEARAKGEFVDVEFISSKKE